MKFKPVLLYILFFAVSFIVFLFLSFPQKQVAAYFSNALSASNPNIDISIVTVTPALPLKLKLNNTKILLGQGLEITPQSLNIFFSPASLFKEKKQIKFETDLFLGSVMGRLSLIGMDPFLFSKAKINFSGVKINNFNYKTDTSDIILGCRLNGEYKQIETRNKNNSGHGTIIIENFSAKMKNSLLNSINLSEVDFTDIELEFNHQFKNIKVIQCTARGSIINVNLKGKLNLIFPLEKTRLNLAGFILPDSPYLAKFASMTTRKSTAKLIKKDGIRFNITGTLKHPKIRI